MKRRNVEVCKMHRRSVKRTKISEGEEGNFGYIRWGVFWTTFMLVDCFIMSRIEFIYVVWMFLRSIFAAFKCRGFAVTVFYVCIVLSTDYICFLIIPTQWLFYVASASVWLQYLYSTVSDKGLCIQTVIVCAFVLYTEHSLRVPVLEWNEESHVGEGWYEYTCKSVYYELSYLMAANCIGYNIVMLGLETMVLSSEKLPTRSARNQLGHDFYFQFTPQCSSNSNGNTNYDIYSNGHIDKWDADHINVNGVTTCARKKDKQQEINVPNHKHKVEKHTHSNGHAANMAEDCDDDRKEFSKGSAKGIKCDKKDVNVKEEKKRSKHKDRDSNDSHSHNNNNTEPSINSPTHMMGNFAATKNCNSETVNMNGRILYYNQPDYVVKEFCRKYSESNKHRETKELKSYIEELNFLRSEVETLRATEEETQRTLQSVTNSEKQIQTQYQQLKRQHTALQQKMQSYRTCERAALERKLSEERKARTLAEQQVQRLQQQLQHRKTSGECDRPQCVKAKAAADAEATTLRQNLRAADVRNARDRSQLRQATRQVRSLESQTPESNLLSSAYSTLQERASQLEVALSLETRVKLDLMATLGDAKRLLQIRQNTLEQQEKDIEELRAQLVSLLPPIETFAVPMTSILTRLRRPDGSPLSQLCSDA